MEEEKGSSGGGGGGGCEAWAWRRQGPGVEGRRCDVGQMEEEEVDDSRECRRLAMKGSRGRERDDEEERNGQREVVSKARNELK